MPHPRIIRLLTLATLVGIGLATLTPGAAPRGGWSMEWPSAADLLVNVALFLPLGLALRHHPLRPTLVILAALTLSAGIELAQGLVIPGRTASPWDLGANLLGAAAGTALPPVVLAGSIAAAWLGSGPLLAPVAPASSQWWGQWAHPFAGTVPFRGGIVSVELNQVPAPDQQLSPSATAAMRAGFGGPEHLFHVRLTTARPAGGRSHLASIADGQGGAVIGYWQLGTDLEITWYARGTDQGLRPPAWRAGGLLATPDSTLASVTTRFQDRRFITVAEGASYHRRSRLTLGPWQGWRLVWPLSPPAEPLALLLSVLWTAASLGPLAWLAVSSGRSRRRRHGA